MRAALIAVMPMFGLQAEAEAELDGGVDVLALSRAKRAKVSRRAYAIKEWNQMRPHVS